MVNKVLILTNNGQQSVRRDHLARALPFRSSPGGLVRSSHDRHFVQTLCKWNRLNQNCLLMTLCQDFVGLGIKCCCFIKFSNGFLRVEVPSTASCPYFSGIVTDCGMDATNLDCHKTAPTVGQRQLCFLVDKMLFPVLCFLDNVYISVLTKNGRVKS